ncbi:MAG: gliding-motility protein MglA [Deltaproteobacteria bacterium]|nr:gliding-motility protein MglA [Deltaproteobacteria bacterium]
MVVYNPAKREIDIKIVYYGPALCGKTTNVQSVHKIMNPQQRGELVSLATKDDRTLFFDFLPIELDSIKGFKTHFHIYTVPGQVMYNLTRRAVLTGADGVVFVADSQVDKMDENIESLNDLKDNLGYYKKDLESFPFVIQYNKRDLDNVVSVKELEEKLNATMVPSFAASAVNGEGVMETLTMCCRLVLKKITDKTGAQREVGVVKKKKIKESEKEKIEAAISELPERK